MKFKISDYIGNKKIIYVDDTKINNIILIAIHTISGDEIVDLVYADHWDRFDSSDNRHTDDYEDTEYITDKREIKEFFAERHVEE